MSLILPRDYSLYKIHTLASQGSFDLKNILSTQKYPAFRANIDDKSPICICVIVFSRPKMLQRVNIIGQRKCFCIYYYFLRSQQLMQV